MERPKPSTYEIYQWYPTVVHCPIAVHSHISGPKDLHRAMGGYWTVIPQWEARLSIRCSGPLPYRSTAQAYNGPTWIFPVFLEKRSNWDLSHHWFSCLFQFPERNVRIHISLSTEFVPFQDQEKVWQRLFRENYNRVWPGIFVRCVVLFLFSFFDTVRCLFKRKREKSPGSNLRHQIA